MLNKLLMTTALAAPLLALAAPAHALITVSFWDVGTGTIVSCADGSACDNGGKVNQVLQINQQVGNFNIVGTFGASTTATLQSSDLAIFNTGTTNDTLRVLVTDNGFTAPVSAISLAGALTFNQDVGATASTFKFYADTNNLLDTFGSLNAPLFSVSHTPTNPADAQSGTAFAPFVATSPFTMSQFAELNFIVGSDITNLGQSMVTIAQQSAVPEPSTWALMLVGFAGLAWAGMRKRRYSREWHGGEYVAQSPVG